MSMRDPLPSVDNVSPDEGIVLAIHTLYYRAIPCNLQTFDRSLSRE